MRSQTQEGKKVYTITDAGRQELQSTRRVGRPRRSARIKAAQVAGVDGAAGAATDAIMADSTRLRNAAEMRAMALEGREVARLMRAAVLASAGNPQRLAQLREIVAHARGELESSLGSSRQVHRPALDSRARVRKASRRRGRPVRSSKCKCILQQAGEAQPRRLAQTDSS